MVDIDKVIEGLKYCQKAACVSYKGNKCPYIRSEYEEGCICEMQNDALEALIELQNAYGYLQKQYYEAQDKLLKEQPEIVRCKDCISWTAGRCGAFDIAMGPEDFCSKAYPFVFGREKDAD